MGDAMSGPERNGIWLKILSTVVPLAIVGLLAFGKIGERVERNRDVQDTQYAAILRELAGLRADIADLKRRQP